MIGYGDKKRRQIEVVRIFHGKFPNLPAYPKEQLVKWKEQYRELESVRPIKKQMPMQ